MVGGGKNQFTHRQWHVAHFKEMSKNETIQNSRGQVV